MAPKYEFVPSLGWVRWELDPDAEDQFTYIAVKFSPAVVAELPLDMEEGYEMHEESMAVQDELDLMSDRELAMTEEVLNMSQQQQHNQDVEELAQAVGSTIRRRSSRLQATSGSNQPTAAQQQHNPKPALEDTSKQANSNTNSSRWDNPKEVKMVVKPNTLKANLKSMKAFMTFCREARNVEVDLYKDPTALPQEQLKKLIADFITRAKQQDGSEYQRTSLLDMVRGVVRHVNSVYKSMVVEGKEAPPELSITKDPLLNVTADSTCRQLTAAGKGIITQQEAFTPDELARIIRTARDLPASSFKHSARKYLFLGINWGGRASEIAKLLDWCLKKAVDDYKEPCIKFTVPNAIKQNQGGLKRSRGAQMLDKEPIIIIIYRDEFDDFLDGFSILDADKIYREAALNGSSKKAACDKLFLQMKHKSSTKDEAKDKFDVSKYLDAFINGPLGENRFSWMLQCLCLLAGVEPRANHALRRTFIQACYRAGMPEAAIMRYTRHQSIEGLRCYARIDDKQLAEFARLRQQQRVAPDLDYLVQAAEAKMKQLSLTNPLQVPGGMQPKAAAAAAAPSINAPTATTASAWEQEFIDLDDYEDATSPVAPTPHKKPALPPKPAMPMLADKPSQAPPAPAAQVVSVPGSSHGSSGINIVINNVPAAPGPPGYPYPPAGPYGGAYVPYGSPPYAGYGAPMPTGPYSGGFPPGMYGGYPAMPQVGSGGKFVQQQLQQHYNHHQQPQHPPFWVPGQHGSMQEQQQSNTAAHTQHVPKLRLRRNVVIDDEEDG